jgi:hypothetical protein
VAHFGFLGKTADFPCANSMTFIGLLPLQYDLLTRIQAAPLPKR